MIAAASNKGGSTSGPETDRGGAGAGRCQLRRGGFAGPHSSWLPGGRGGVTVQRAFAAECVQYRQHHALRFCRSGCVFETRLTWETGIFPPTATYPPAELDRDLWPALHLHLANKTPSAARSTAVGSVPLERRGPAGSVAAPTPSAADAPPPHVALVNRDQLAGAGFFSTDQNKPCRRTSLPGEEQLVTPSTRLRETYFFFFLASATRR
jgi:hypothetical protein